MRYIIDTHVFLWYIEGNEKLSRKVIDTIEDESNQILLSKASLWEIAIKISIGKLAISISFESLDDFIREHDFSLIDFSFQDFSSLLTLPFHHQDPFDRMIIAQAMSENIPIITDDGAFANYDVEIIR